MPLKISAKEYDQAAEYLWYLLLEGYDDEQARAEIDIDLDDYKKLKLHALDKRSAEIKATPIEHVYAQYLIDQNRNLRDLDDMIGQFKTSKQYNAMVGAVRLRADLTDRILSVGQECGVIHKAPTKKQIVHGFVIGELSNSQLQDVIHKELSDMNAMMAKFGDKPFIDVEAGPIYHGPAIPLPRSADDVDEPAPSKKTPKDAKKGSKEERKPVKQRM